MAEVVPTPTASEGRTSRFGLAPPRRFELPAILLLLSEQPGYGYNLQKRLQDFRFGDIDRPTIYRALAQLETDGLVESSTAVPKAGHARRVYGITSLGERVLRVWMSVIKEERDCLGRVLRRYQATGTIDAFLAEVDGGWASALGPGLSPVAASPPTPRLPPFDTGAPVATGSSESGERVEHPQRFRLLSHRSVVLIEVRSTVGPISFGAIGIDGSIEADVANGVIRAGTHATAHVEIAMNELRSGNSVYDAELLRRINARRFPVTTIDLRACNPTGSANRYRLEGELTFHGVTRPAHGTVIVHVADDRRLVVTGEQVFDIRDFDVPSPTMLMLRIYPDVRVRLQVEAELEEV
jgi:DNA-binding PadR family transcriptional regulator